MTEGVRCDDLGALIGRHPIVILAPSPAFHELPSPAFYFIDPCKDMTWPASKSLHRLCIIAQKTMADSWI